MAIICHPLTAVNGSPAYTADNYRHVVNSMLFPSNSSALGSVQGIRVSSNSPVLSITSLQVKVTSHVGVINLSSGTYTYMLDSTTSIQIPDKTNNYKIAVIVNDPSASIGSGSVPEAKLAYFLATVPDSQISGIVLGQVNAGVVSDTAVRLDCNWIISVPSKTVLDTVSAVDGQTAVTKSDNVTYVRKNGVWSSFNDLLTLSNSTYWSATWNFTIVQNMGILSFTATRKTSQWQTTSAWGSSSLFSLNSKYSIPIETHTPLITNANISGLGGIMCQAYQNNITLRATQAMTIGVGGWCSGSIVFGIK